MLKHGAFQSCISYHHRDLGLNQEILEPAYASCFSSPSLCLYSPTLLLYPSDLGNPLPYYPTGISFLFQFLGGSPHKATVDPGLLHCGNIARYKNTNTSSISYIEINQSIVKLIEQTDKRAPPKLYLVDSLTCSKHNPKSCYTVVVPTKPFQSPFIGWFISQLKEHYLEYVQKPIPILALTFVILDIVYSYRQDLLYCIYWTWTGRPLARGLYYGQHRVLCYG